MAAANGYTKCVRLLVDAGADKETKKHVRDLIARAHSHFFCCFIRLVSIHQRSIPKPILHNLLLVRSLHLPSKSDYMFPVASEVYVCALLLLCPMCATHRPVGLH